MNRFLISENYSSSRSPQIGKLEIGILVFIVAIFLSRKFVKRRRNRIEQHSRDPPMKLDDLELQKLLEFFNRWKNSAHPIVSFSPIIQAYYRTAVKKEKTNESSRAKTNSSAQRAIIMNESKDNVIFCPFWNAGNSSYIVEIKFEMNGMPSDFRDYSSAQPEVVRFYEFYKMMHENGDTRFNQRSLYLYGDVSIIELTKMIIEDFIVSLNLNRVRIVFKNPGEQPSELSESSIDEEIIPLTIEFNTGMGSWYSPLSTINFGINSFTHRTVLHEFGHFFGLQHEFLHPSLASILTFDFLNDLLKEGHAMPNDPNISLIGTPIIKSESIDKQSVMQYNFPTQVVDFARLHNILDAIPIIHVDFGYELYYDYSEMDKYFLKCRFAQNCNVQFKKETEYNTQSSGIIYEFLNPYLATRSRFLAKNKDQLEYGKTILGALQEDDILRNLPHQFLEEIKNNMLEMTISDDDKFMIYEFIKIGKFSGMLKTIISNRNTPSVAAYTPREPSDTPREPSDTLRAPSDADAYEPWSLDNALLFALFFAVIFAWVFLIGTLFFWIFQKIRQSFLF